MNIPDFENIWEGWTNWLNKKKLSPDQLHVANERLGICKKCDWLVEEWTSKIVKLLVNKIVKREKQPYVSSFKCNACGCPIKQKTLSFKDTCGLIKQNRKPKWLPVKFRRGVRID